MLLDPSRDDHNQNPQIPAAIAQKCDSDEPQIPTLIGTLGEYAGKGDHFLRVICPGCGRTCRHGWNVRKYPLRPQHRVSLCGCLPRGYFVIPELRPLRRGAM